MTTPGAPARFDGLRVVIFEARMAGSLAELVAKHGGDPVSAPALREIPLGTVPEVVAFVEGLGREQFDLVVFETGAGVRYLAGAFRDGDSPIDWPALLARPRVVARGPKPSSALRELGVPVDFRVPEPNTWRETLALLDDRCPVRGLQVAVLEYGKPGPGLIEGLEDRGASATRVPVYRWALPEDLRPLRAGIAELIDGKAGAALFTAGQQVEHLLQVADDDGNGRDLRSALADRVVIGSVGPSTSEILRSHGLPVDIEPDHPKSGHLVAAVAARWKSSLATRRRRPD